MTFCSYETLVDINGDVDNDEPGACGNDDLLGASSSGAAADLSQLLDFTG